jgi:hypothetical protein
MRFFFDYKSDERTLYDYRGEEFNSANGAIEFATEISQGLSHSLQDEWSGWFVEVRNPDGAMVFRFPVVSATRRFAA